MWKRNKLHANRNFSSFLSAVYYWVFFEIAKKNRATHSMQPIQTGEIMLQNDWKKKNEPIKCSFARERRWKKAIVPFGKANNNRNVTIVSNFKNKNEKIAEFWGKFTYRFVYLQQFDVNYLWIKQFSRSVFIDLKLDARNHSILNWTYCFFFLLHWIDDIWVIDRSMINEW